MKMADNTKSQVQYEFIFLPGESHGQRSLAGYSPWDHKSWTLLSNWWQEMSVRPPFLPPSPTSFPFFFEPGFLSSLEIFDVST